MDLYGRARRSLLVLILAGFAPGCHEDGGGGGDRSFAPPPPPGGPVCELDLPFLTVEQGPRSCHPVTPQDGVLALVFRSQAQWGTFWASHTACIFPPPPAPVIDFATQTVLVVVTFAPTSGHVLRIDRVDLCGSKAELRVTRTVPGPTCIVLTVITAPFHLVTVDRIATEIEIVSLITDVTVCP